MNPGKLLAALADLARAGDERALDVTGQSQPVWPDDPDRPAGLTGLQQSLARAGWQLRDAFASRWGGDPVQAALALTADLPAPPSR